MSTTLLVILFIAGYAAIAMEHPLRISKTATALLLAVISWLVLLIFHGRNEISLLPELSHHLSGIAEIVFFLMGAMTIVELIDTHRGFRAVSNLVKTKNKVSLLWIICFLTFFLSAILDNLTTAIVMVSILRKMIDDKKDRMIFASMVIVAANAGGAWSPIGDVTTTMLWIGGQISASSIAVTLFIPSIISLLLPLVYFSLKMKGEKIAESENDNEIPEPYSTHIFVLGILSLISVPVFKQLTHLPPYMGILLGLSVMWVLTEILHSKRERKDLQVASVLSKIDLSSILFFVGILLTVAALQTAGILELTSNWFDKTVPNKDVVVTLLGVASSIIDNVPLVAATIGMYPLNLFPMDDKLWEMIAYCAGTGGSLLIIGSAAGVVVMGMENISFGWYLKKTTVPALVGYLAGVICYLGIYTLLHS
ncbi:MAG: sodium:proton antiporter NhaD [Bacteroidota bacterium]